jgi:hypothetical protein
MEYQDTASSMDRKFSFTEGEVGVIKSGLKTKLFVADEPRPARETKWKALLLSLCGEFSIPEVHLEFDATQAEPGWGKYCQASKTITMGARFSLTTLLHFFAVALMDARQGDAEFVAMIRGAEFHSPAEVAAAFSLSLFREAAPKMYEAAKLSGRIMFFQEPAVSGPRRAQPQQDDSIDDEPEPAPGSTVADIDPENRVDRGNGFGED